MRIESTRAILVLTMATAGIVAPGAAAQTAPPPASSTDVIPLEQIADEPPGGPPAPPASRTGPPVASGQASSIRPSAQRLDYRAMGGHAALRQLPNPFEGGCGPERRGLFGRARRRTAPALTPMPMPTPRGVGAGPPMAEAAPQPLPPAVAAEPTGVGAGPTASPTAPNRPPAESPGAAPPPVEPLPPLAATTPPPAPAAAAGPSTGGSPAPPPTGSSPTAPAPQPPATATPESGPSGPPGSVSPAPGAPGSGAGAGAGATTTPGTSAASTSVADLFGGPGAPAGTDFGAVAATAPTPFAMIGNIVPFTTHPVFAHVGVTTPPIPSPIHPPGPPTPPGARGASPIFPSVRNFNISENQSPRPQDRVFFNFNFYNNVNDTINQNDLSPVTQMKAYVYNFGVEKTFNRGMGSIGIRLPLDTLTANSFGNVVSTPTVTSLGDLTIFGKYILAQNLRTGSLVSALFGITPQTGPGRFAGAPYLFPLNSTTFQPALGYIYNHERLYFQGFSGFSFSANPNDVSLMYNDLAVGYYLYRNPDSRSWLTALAPTFEAHVNDPINHRDWFSRYDLAGSPDAVNLTYGLNIGIRNTAVLTAAFVTPVTTPKPFDSEAILMLNIFYGRSRARTIPVTPPPL